MPPSPAKRARIFDSEEEEEEGLKGELAKSKAELKKAKTRIYALERELQILKNENRSLEATDERITDQYAQVREQSNRQRMRDSTVIRELNSTISRLQKAHSDDAHVKAKEKEQSSLLDKFTKTIEQTISDVGEDKDGAKEHECPICYEEMILRQCGLLVCGHYFHSACIANFQTTTVWDEGEDEEACRVECPECRKHSFVANIVHKLKNFDEGWVMLLDLANRWKQLNNVEVPIASDNISEYSADFGEALFDPLEKREAADESEYESTDHEDDGSVGPNPNVTPPGSPGSDEQETPSASVGRRLNDLAMSSVDRRKRLEDLVAKRRAAKKRS